MWEDGSLAHDAKYTAKIHRHSEALHCLHFQPDRARLTATTWKGDVTCHAGWAKRCLLNDVQQRFRIWKTPRVHVTAKYTAATVRISAHGENVCTGFGEKMCTLTNLHRHSAKIFNQSLPKWRPQWPHSLRRGSAAAHLLGLWVRIPPGAWMSLVCHMLPGRGLCVGLITSPEESYGVWCVCMWSRSPVPAPLGLLCHEGDHSQCSPNQLK